MDDDDDDDDESFRNVVSLFICGAYFFFCIPTRILRVRVTHIAGQSSKRSPKIADDFAVVANGKLEGNKTTNFRPIPANPWPGNFLHNIRAGSEVPPILVLGKFRRKMAIPFIRKEVNYF